MLRQAKALIQTVSNITVFFIKSKIMTASVNGLTINDTEEKAVTVNINKTPTSQSQWSRYDQHFWGIKRYNAFIYRVIQTKLN